MRQSRWMKLFSEFDFEVKYHLGKANVDVVPWNVAWLGPTSVKRDGEWFILVGQGLASIWRDVKTSAIEEAYTTKYPIHPGADATLSRGGLWGVLSWGDWYEGGIIDWDGLGFAWCGGGGVFIWAGGSGMVGGGGGVVVGGWAVWWRMERKGGEENGGAGNDA
ncbi:hypothetical protein Tco_0547925 [Tanacetum coccineum]